MVPLWDKVCPYNGGHPGTMERHQANDKIPQNAKKMTAVSTQIKCSRVFATQFRQAQLSSTLCRVVSFGARPRLSSFVQPWRLGSAFQRVWRAESPMRGRPGLSRLGGGGHMPLRVNSDCVYSMWAAAPRSNVSSSLSLR